MNPKRIIMFEHRSNYVPPIIRLKGKWVVAAGFTPGEQVDVVQVAPGHLAIRRREPEQCDSTQDTQPSSKQ